MKIAVVGTGIAGNVAAYKLSQEHQVTVYEASNYIGGHTNTHDVVVDGIHHAIDCWGDSCVSGFNQLLAQFRQMQRMMKQLSGGKGQRALANMLGGGFRQ